MNIEELSLGEVIEMDDINGAKCLVIFHSTLSSVK